MLRELIKPLSLKVFASLILITSISLFFAINFHRQFDALGFIFGWAAIIILVCLGLRLIWNSGKICYQKFSKNGNNKRIFDSREKNLDMLIKLKTLHEKKVLTDEEFEIKSAVIKQKLE